jgi:hypothetical protein
MAKPIFIILFTEDTPIDTVARCKDQMHKSIPGIFEDYHVITATANIDVIDFKLLNGIEENYTAIDEIKAKILEIV